MGRTVISHVETSFGDVKRIGQLAEAGCYIEFDTFGRLGPMATLKSMEAPSDGQRVDAIIQLIEMGYLNHILISHDICTKMRLNQYGGHGYGHILYYVVPLMLAKGISEDQIRTIMVENPKRLLQFI